MSQGAWAEVGTLYRNEIRLLLRDTRTLLVAVVAPLLLFPVIAFLMSSVEQRETDRLESATYVVGIDDRGHEAGRPLLDRALASLEADTAVRTRLEVAPVDPFRVDSLLKAGDLDLGVRLLAPDPTDSIAIPAIELTYRGRSDFSRRAESVLRDGLTALRDDLRDSVYFAAGFPIARDQVATIQGESVASAARVAGAFLGLALTPFILFLMLSGGSIVAADAIAGEKERGTLETLLTTAVDRRSIVRAKLGAVITVGLVVAGTNLLNLLVYTMLGVIELPTSLAVELSPLQFTGLALLVVPLAILVGSTLLLLSGMARSYKEYQTWFFPLFLILLLPSLLPLLPGLELRSAIVAVPIGGLAVAIRDLLLGEPDLLFSGVALLTTGGVATMLMRRAEATLSNERLISGAELDEADLRGGPALFPRHVLAWFTGLWVIFFVTVLWFGETLGVRGQVLVNLVVIFLGGSLFIIRRYRMSVRETFRLYRPRVSGLIAAVVGAPSALILGLTLSESVVQWLFPVPQSMIEAMSEGLGMDLPYWQLLFFVAVMPALFEEFAFRGLLVRGLRGLRIPTWAVIVGGGMIFGLFHVSLFRIFPTAWLGMNLVAVVLLTRSIWPVVLWHFLNNALALTPAALGWIDAESFAFPAWAPGVAALGLVLSYAILWKAADPKAQSAFRPARAH